MFVRCPIVCLFSAMLLSACPVRAEETPSARRIEPTTEVSVEVKLIELPEELFRELDRGGVFGDPNKKKNPQHDVVFLNDPQVLLLMKAIQGDAGASVMQAPRLTMFNGQAGGINTMETQNFVTDVEVVQREKGLEYAQKSTPIPLGIRLAVRPIVSADRRSVQVHLDARMNDLISCATPCEITTKIAPGENAEPDAQPIVRTTFVQQPKVNRMRVDRTLNIPDGSTALLPGLKKIHEGRNEYGPPILSKLPIIGRSFVQVGYGRETRHVLILVTPRIVANPDK